MITNPLTTDNILSSLFYEVVTKLDSNEAIKFITGNAQNIVDSFVLCIQAVITGDNPNDYVYLACAVTNVKARTDVLISQLNDSKNTETLVAEYVGNVRFAIKELVSCLKIQ